MGLLVGDHLQAVLDRAQEYIGRLKPGARLFADPAILLQLPEHCERLAPAQFHMPSAGDELLGLHEELDFADAAASELDVVAFYGDIAMPVIDVNLLLHRLHVGERDIIEMLAPDEGRQMPEKCLTCRDVTGTGARFDHR